MGFQTVPLPFAPPRRAPPPGGGSWAGHALRPIPHRQVEESVRRGARLLLGGAIPEGPGFFHPPSGLAAGAEGMPAVDEGAVGPVGAGVPAEVEPQVVRAAKPPPHGPRASGWTPGDRRAH